MYRVLALADAVSTFWIRSLIPQTSNLLLKPQSVVPGISLSLSILLVMGGVGFLLAPRPKTADPKHYAEIRFWALVSIGALFVSLSFQ